MEGGRGFDDMGGSEIVTPSPPHLHTLEEKGVLLLLKVKRGSVGLLDETNTLTSFLSLLL